ncbi:MAG: histidinol phosphatase [Ruminiclostridium sp.]|nr:histidinol phosphatase [Ruminiclostridium sp.]
MYKYETHVHTSETSACASANGAAQAMFYKSKGYTGIVVTDHFFNGNTSVPHELPWEEKVNRFCLGYEKAKEQGDKIGLDVFFGWEYSYHGADLLTYGLDKQWLLKHPMVMDMDVNSYCDFVREQGGIIVHAHPFREADYIAMIRLFPRKCDACEIINSCRSDFENNMAKHYAESYGLRPFAGSDNHSAAQEKLNGVDFDEIITSEQHFAQLIKEDKYRIF